jgi:RNA polymerase sigma-70 factor (ECF subfamily)
MPFRFRRPPRAPLRLDTNEAWLEALRGPRRDEALQRLREPLVRGLRAALARRGAHRATLLAEDFAQDALLQILARLDTFRGESRFTTWAQKIAVRIALTELRRKRWKNVSLEDLAPADAASDSLSVLAGETPDPAGQTASQLLFERIQRAIDEELTERQRLALNAVMVHGMPLEEVARRMGTNRNALYKLLHDGRKRLKKSLEAQGISPEEFRNEG